MKILKSLAGWLVVLALMLGTANALGGQSCCVKSKSKGKDCDHKCCVEARKERKTCEKCQKEASCCDKAIAQGKDCAHKCCVEASKSGKVCESCNKAEAKK